MKILILGITGMLGSCLYRYFADEKNFSIVGTIRNEEKKIFFREDIYSKIVIFNDYKDIEKLDQLFSYINPNYVINCIGVIKQKMSLSSPVNSIFFNSYFPQLLDKLTKKHNFKVIHFSTDCVFDGNRGSYKESDIPLPKDFYGLSKLIGELNSENSLTLRTSIIGHEISSSLSLVDWFLSSKNSVKGYTKAIYSGFPTVEIARIIDRYILPDESIHGIYNLSSKPISKYDLLNIIGKKYKHNIKIIPEEKISIDRSLDSSLFISKTNYICPSWHKLINDMYEFYKKYESKK